jgi:hypothetical protein
MSAVFFKVVSIDFLLPYSFEPAAHPIPNPRPHFGVIRRTDITNTIPVTIRANVNNVCMIYYRV